MSGVDGEPVRKVVANGITYAGTVETVIATTKLFIRAGCGRQQESTGQEVSTRHSLTVREKTEGVLATTPRQKTRHALQ